MNLENLVPPLGLCKLIPAGEFADSAGIYGFDPYYEQWDFLLRECEGSWPDIIPAPTLQEIMAELPACDCYRFSDKNEWTVLLVNGPVDDGVKSDSPATAALKLWLKLKGIDNEE